MMIEVLLFAIALGVLVKSAEAFTEKAEVLGVALGIPPFLVGVTIVAAGTGMPELASSVAATLSGNSEIVMGNVLGSNIANILLILGVSALFLKRERVIKWDILHADLTFLILTTLLIGIVIWDGNVSIEEAALLFLGYIIYGFYNYDVNKSKKVESKDPKKKFKAIDGVILVISIALIALSADTLIDSALKISETYGIAPEIVGLLAIAVGTSLPELAVSVAAVRKGNLEIALGNVSGSNIFNTFVVSSIPRFIGNVSIPTSLVTNAYVYLILATAMFLSIVIDRKMHKYEGAMLLLLYAFFVLHAIGG